jgi:hypothetical protein
MRLRNADLLNSRRARRHVLWLQERYDGKCQICVYDPLERYGRQVCHAHHIQWLSRGGEDKLKNLVFGLSESPRCNPPGGRALRFRGPGIRLQEGDYASARIVASQ